MIYLEHSGILSARECLSAVFIYRGIMPVVCSFLQINHDQSQGLIYRRVCIREGFVVKISKRRKNTGKGFLSRYSHWERAIFYLQETELFEKKAFVRERNFIFPHTISR